MPTNQRIQGFRLPASTGHTLDFEAFRGKVPVALVFVSDPQSPEGASIVEELDRRLKDFGSERSQVLVVARLTARRARDVADDRGLAVPILADASGAMARDFDADESSIVAVVANIEGGIEARFDPFFDGTDPQPAVERLLEAIRRTGD
jgi:peroxiredoxin